MRPLVHEFAEAVDAELNQDSSDLDLTVHQLHDKVGEALDDIDSKLGVNFPEYNAEHVAESIIEIGTTLAVMLKRVRP